MIEILGNVLNQGNKIFADMPISDGNGNNTLIPYYIIHGAHEGPIICITSGVHGTEYPGIAANLKLYNDINPNDVFGTIIGCPMCNYEAFVHRSMFVNPLDKKNLNNVFPGNSKGTITEIIADVLLKKFISLADYHIDMHSGDSIEYLFPYVFYHKSSSKNTSVDSQAKKMAEAYALDYIAVTELDGYSTSDKGNFYSSVSELGIPCIQPEIGGIGLIEEKTKMLHHQGVLNVLSHLNILKSESITTNSHQVTLSNFFRLYSQSNGVFNAFVLPGQTIKKGDVIATITNYHGDCILETFKASDSGVVLWLMSSLATRENDTLMAIGVF